ncbi:MAG: hypothetical protein GX268_03215 [Methanomicrobiales archaeon]|nr:hypothetical protein [Methanomicrobiales archaeon]
MHRRRTKAASGGRGISEHLALENTPSKISDQELEVRELTSVDQLFGFECSYTDFLSVTKYLLWIINICPSVIVHHRGLLYEIPKYY